MTKQVSQDFYIETVTSTMELMEISREEAIKDTLESFKAQGIDASNLDLDSFDKNASNNLTEVVESLKYSTIKEESLIEGLISILNESSKGLQQRIKLGAQQILPVLVEKSNPDTEEGQLSMKCCAAVIEGNPDVVKAEHLTKIFKEFLAKSTSGTVCKFLFDSLHFFLNACTKHEENRKTLFNLGIMPATYEILKSLLRNFPDKPQEQDYSLLADEEIDELISSCTSECCRVLRVIVKDDDVRAEFGQGCMNAVKFCESSQFLEETLQTMQNKRLSKSVLIQLIYTFNFVVVRENFCQRVVNSSGLETIIHLFTNHFDKVSLINALVDFMNILAHSDVVRENLTKIKIGQDQNLLSVLYSLVESSLNNAGLIKSIMSLFSNVTLRRPENGKSLVYLGLPQLCSNLFAKFKTSNNGMMRATCMCLRNSIDKNRELATLFIPLSAIVNPRDVSYIQVPDEDVQNLEIETHLNDLMKNPNCRDEAKSAARDLGLKVDLKNEYMDKKK